MTSPEAVNPQSYSAGENGHPLPQPYAASPSPCTHPRPGLTLVRLDKRMFPLEMFTIAISYIRSHPPQQQEKK